MTKPEAIEKLLHAEQLIKEVTTLIPKDAFAKEVVTEVCIELKFLIEELKNSEFSSIETV